MYKKLLYCLLTTAFVVALITYSEEAQDIQTPAITSAENTPPTSAAPTENKVSSASEAPSQITPPATIPATSSETHTPTTPVTTAQAGLILTQTPIHPEEHVDTPKTSETFAEKMGIAKTDTTPPPSAPAPTTAPMAEQAAEPKSTGIPTCAALCDKVCNLLKEETAQELEEKR